MQQKNSSSASSREPADIYDHSSYDLGTLEDEIRVDRLCRRLLKDFQQHLLRERDLAPLAAGTLCGGADFFLRDYMIDNRRRNIFRISQDLITGFAGNWYIVSTLEPNMVELKNILEGTWQFYCFCAEKKLIDSERLRQLDSACQNHDYYRQRIESFHGLRGDGFIAWNQACPLEQE